MEVTYRVVHRKRHKEYCTPASIEKHHPKDGLLRFARYIHTNRTLYLCLQSYAAHALPLNPADAFSGEGTFIVLTFTTIPDVVKGSGRILQLAKVELQDRESGTQQAGEDMVAGRPEAEGFIFFHLLFKSDVVGIEGCHYLPGAIQWGSCAEILEMSRDIGPVTFLL